MLSFAFFVLHFLNFKSKKQKIRLSIVWIYNILSKQELSQKMKNQVFVTTTIHAKFIFFSDVFSALETKIVTDCSSLVFLQTMRNKVPAGSSQKSIFQQKVLRTLFVKGDMSNSFKKVFKRTSRSDSMQSLCHDLEKGSTLLFSLGSRDSDMSFLNTLHKEQVGMLHYSGKWHSVRSNVHFIEGKGCSWLSLHNIIWIPLGFEMVICFWSFKEKLDFGLP